MTALKTIFFILLVPGFLLWIVPVDLVTQIGGPALPVGPWTWAAIPFWVTGVAVVIWCAADFVRKGHGTPAPIEPPKELVISGLYRYVRNPMYVGVLLIQVGHIVWFGTLAQGIYWFFLCIGFNLFIRANEEPHLRRTFGAAYEEYCRKVPRWIPRFKKTSR
jgi:protein-S-isoprenylcysteine O-methyltransferase Ste14